MIRSYLPRLAVLLAAMTVTTAGAAEPAFEITPFGTYRDGGRFLDGAGAGLDLAGSAGGALALNWRAAEQGAQYELLYSRQSTETDAAALLEMDVEYLHIGGTTVIGELGSRVEPFAAGGVGATRLTPDAASLGRETRWSVNLGGGVRIPLAAHVRLRLEARGYLTWLGSDPDVFCAGGCAIVARSKTFFQYEALAGVSIGF